LPGTVSDPARGRCRSSLRAAGPNADSIPLSGATCPSFPIWASFRGSSPPFHSRRTRPARLSAASTTGRLLILKEGKVAVEKEGIEIARVTERGAVFGELSELLDQPHTADVRALEASQFHVADAATILRIDPIALLYVATVLAQRLDSANKALF